MEDNIINDPEEFLKDKYKEGCLFLLEKYLDKLPYDWLDTITFIFTNGIDQNKGSYTIIMDDNMSERFFKITSFSEIPVYILPDKIMNDKKVIWNVLLAKEYLEGDPDPKKLFIGGENLRQYCDERNIYYRSCLISNDKLLSGSNLMWQKKDGEDCRKVERTDNGRIQD